MTHIDALRAFGSLKLKQATMMGDFANKCHLTPWVSLVSQFGHAWSKIGNNLGGFLALSTKAKDIVVFRLIHYRVYIVA